MDTYVSRAMMISCLDGLQLAKLHLKEDEKKELLANFEIQRCLGLPTIRDRWAIPEDAAIQEAHAARLRSELLSGKIAEGADVEVQDKDGNRTMERLKPWENLTNSRMEAVHEYDRAVLKAIQAGSISFSYSGAKSGNRLRDRVQAGRANAYAD